MQPGAPLSDGPAVLRYAVPGFLDAWTVTEVLVPEAAWHSAILRQLEALLLHWVEREALTAAVYRNLAIRVREEHPRVGFDPDLCVVAPRPPEAAEIPSLCLWKPGHVPPALCIETVSPGHPSKDYVDIPARCAAAGVRELWVFDPKLAGPAAPSGPHLFQLFARQSDGTFSRVHAGDGPAFSPLLRAWCVILQGTLVIAADPAGDAPWLTAVDAERVAKEAERAAKEAAYERIAELEAERSRRGP